MTVISYAQNYEDIMLLRAFREVSEGFYVDVGAAWPDEHSVTKLFYEKGWNGINIEPNPEFLELLKEQRTRDINLGTAAGDSEDRAVLNLISGTGLSTLDEDVAQTHTQNGWNLRAIDIEVKPLRMLLEENLTQNQEIHFLKIDAEGFEKKIIKGNDWERYRPWIVVVEATEPLSSEEADISFEDDLKCAGYELVYDDGLNRFYIAFERRELTSRFEKPPNVFDDFISYDLVKTKSQLESTIKEFNSAAEKLENQSLELERLKEKVRDREEENATISDELFFRKSQIDEYETSLSWRLTKPLRSMNPKRAVFFIARQAFKSELARSIILYKLKPYLKKYPKLWEWLKQGVLFGEEAGSDRFEYLQFGATRVAFSKGPLQDQRGIGRVTRELLERLRAASVPAPEGDAVDWYFYASIHWCPEELPSNSIVMIHDVIPMIFEDKFKEVARLWREKYKKIAQRARLIVTISETSAADIRDYLGVKHENIRVIYNGVKQLPSNNIKSIQLPSLPYFAFFGSHDEHKNIQVILKAFQDERLSGIKLLMVGDNDQCKSLVKEYGVEQSVIFMGRLSDEETGFVLRNATALLFPSLYEGFGLPPLEAGLLGTPTISSNRPAMSEVLESSAIFIDPYDHLEWVETISEISQNQALRASYGEHARKCAEGYTWDISSNKLISIFIND